MKNDAWLRDQLAQLLDWEKAHAGFDRVVEGIPSGMRGTRPPGLPHSPWEVLEHIRLAQFGILDFSVNPEYVEVRWPDDYWPASPEPPSPSAWEDSVASYKRDREAMRRLTLDPAVDLAARVPSGDGQTFLREIVLAADHTAYHVGELVTIRRLLGCWSGD